MSAALYVSDKMVGVGCLTESEVFSLLFYFREKIK